MQQISFSAGLRWEPLGSLQRSPKLVGLRGHLLYHIHAVASQCTVKCGFTNASNVLCLSGPTGWAYNTDRICTPEKKS